MLGRIIFFLLFFSQQAIAKPLIITSITPIASLLDMLVQDMIDIDVIASYNACPHSFQARPSDYKKTVIADMAIYIHPDFDSFAAKLMNKNHNVVKIGDFKNLFLLKNHNAVNWHIWLDTHNVRIILNELTRVIVKEFPEFTAAIHNNLTIAFQVIDELDERKKKYVNLDSTLIFDESLEYLLNFSSKNIYKSFHSEFKSLRYDQKLSQLIEDRAVKCLVISSEQSGRYYEKFKLHLLQLESENWTKNTSSNGLRGLFKERYLSLLEQLTPCLKTN